MPVYEYHCGACGPFTKFRSLKQSSGPETCPECGRASPKVFSAVNLRAMRPENRVAWERNERSTHAPHVCGAGCSHSHGKPKPRTDRTDDKTGEKPALQASSKRNSRPWMLGH